MEESGQKLDTGNKLETSYEEPIGTGSRWLMSSSQLVENIRGRTKDRNGSIVVIPVSVGSLRKKYKLIMSFLWEAYLAKKT